MQSNIHLSAYIMKVDKLQYLKKESKEHHHALNIIYEGEKGYRL